MKTLEVDAQNSGPEPPELAQRARPITLLLMDCDGVLTDAHIWLTADGDEQKSFHTRDGQGLSVWHRAGYKSGIISGRASKAVDRRARELKMDYVHQSASNKIAALEEILSQAEVSPDECCFIGDDLADISVMRRVGFAVAVADAAADTKSAAHYITSVAGGCGAVREVIDLILRAQDKWPELLAEIISSG